MRVSNYSVAMSAQYFNLQFASQETTVSTTQKELSGSSTQISAAALDKQKQEQTNNQLSYELSKALLKNMQSSSRSLVGDRVEISTTNMEAQALNFSLAAIIQTDSKEISISLDINLSRSFIERKILRVEDLQRKSLVDPLVINFNGELPSLSEKTFSFDLDSDGQVDQISQLKSGNGFLALDKNNNGIIDNGLELFGTKNGDGFADLSKYDDDKNGWIDENDAIFNKLRVWQKDGQNDKLIALGEVGIGAIFLGNITTPFTLKSNTNEMLGELRKSGFVLFENGKAGVMSHLDMALNPTSKESINKIDGIIQNLSGLRLDTLYKPKETQESSMDEKIQAIQRKIKALEAKLPHADDVEKPTLQIRIGMLLSQMLQMLQPHK